jgi:5-methylcytosine-specific restriction endonuclease McrA
VCCGSLADRNNLLAAPAFEGVDASTCVRSAPQHKSMDRQWLAAELASGRSIESLAREVGKDPSTVAYWATKYGLASMLASKHAAKGRIDREQLERLVDDGLTLEELARAFNRTSSSVRHWLAKYGLKTARARPAVENTGMAVVIRRCRKHGYTAYVRTGTEGRYRCKRCRSENVIRCRRKVKQTLINENGGCCQLCGYDRYAGALEFHHLQPATKAFAISMSGVARSLARAREEARKCLLVCANCHAEIEGGVATMPPGIDRIGWQAKRRSSYQSGVIQR